MDISRLFLFLTNSSVLKNLSEYWPAATDILRLRKYARSKVHPYFYKLPNDTGVLVNKKSANTLIMSWMVISRYNKLDDGEVISGMISKVNWHPLSLPHIQAALLKRFGVELSVDELARRQEWISKLDPGSGTAFSHEFKDSNRLAPNYTMEKEFEFLMGAGDDKCVSGRFMSPIKNQNLYIIDNHRIMFYGKSGLTIITIKTLSLDERKKEFFRINKIDDSEFTHSFFDSHGIPKHSVELHFMGYIRSLSVATIHNLLFSSNVIAAKYDAKVSKVTMNLTTNDKETPSLTEASSNLKTIVIGQNAIKVLDYKAIKYYDR